MCRVRQRGPRWLDLRCETSPPALLPNWGETQTSTPPIPSKPLRRPTQKVGSDFISQFAHFVSHLADRVMVMSDTSILRQFRTLSRMGLLTCVPSTKRHHRLGQKANKSIIETVKIKRKICVFIIWDHLMLSDESCTFIPDKDRVFFSLYFPSCWG